MAAAASVPWRPGSSGKTSYSSISFSWCAVFRQPHGAHGGGEAEKHLMRLHHAGDAKLVRSAPGRHHHRQRKRPRTTPRRRGCASSTRALGGGDRHRRRGPTTDGGRSLPSSFSRRRRWRLLNSKRMSGASRGASVELARATAAALHPSPATSTQGYPIHTRHVNTRACLLSTRALHLEALSSPRRHGAG